MKIRAHIIFLMILGVTGFAFAQTKAVTNADLAKFREKRLKAEKDLRENYAKLGFPSPEEMEKLGDADAKAREELSIRLRTERLERERIAEEMRAREAASPEINVYLTQPTNDYSGYGFLGGGYYLSGSYYRSRHRSYKRFHNGLLWRATPGGIVYEPGSRSSYVWPAPRRQRHMPGWRRPR